VIVSVREIRFWSLVDVLLGFIMLGYALILIQQDFGIQQAVLFSFVLLLGGIMIYCFWLMLTTIAFWVVRINDMVNLFEGIYAAGRWPVSIYPNWLRFGLTFLVPVAFAVTIPAEALTGRLTLPTVFFATGLTIVFALLTRFIWRLGVRNYSGASA
jgi:ABC-2 type transport system permease protein